MIYINVIKIYKFKYYTIFYIIYYLLIDAEKDSKTNTFCIIYNLKTFKINIYYVKVLVMY